ncbi:MAG TPA: enoyl-CoA hydratase/isomerase family protein [Gemmatimonadaceae bacterium]|nr:enoyl-CoA hydratase/isomerase family protein [Gemmatimonadaceae bacterium]
MARVRVAITGGVGRVTLSRPEKKNALDAEAARELVDALMEFEGDDAVRAVLVAGDGDDFCGGADIEALAALLDAPIEAHARDAADLGRVFLTIRGMSKPVVAAVHGRALGGGCGLATACDVVLAREDAQFGYPEVRIGFVPALVMNLLRRSVGEKRAFDLAASGRTIDAAEAERVGLVTRVLPATGFADEVERYVLGLAANPTTSMALTKRLFYRLELLSFRDGIAEGVEVNVEARQTEDFRAGILRFTQKARKK